MSGEVIFEIARFGVDTDEEVLVEKAQLLKSDTGLAWQFAGNTQNPCDTDDLAAAISGVPALRDVNPNQVTRIEAAPYVAQELPLALQPTGDWKYIDESLWSEAMSWEHLEPETWDLLPLDPHRVLYVNDQRWHAWQTSRGNSMLPGDGGQPKFATEWANATCYESAVMNSGETHAVIGLLTPTIVIDIYTPSGGDPVDEDDPGSSISLTRWDGTVDEAGRLLATWTTSSPVDFYFYYDGTVADPKFVVQLFIEAASGTESPISRTAEQLIEASGYDMDYFSRGESGPPSTDFGLVLHVELDVLESALAAIARDDPVYADMITAARNPESVEARARDERVAAIQEEFSL